MKVRTKLGQIYIQVAIANGYIRLYKIFKTKNTTKDKEGHFIITKRQIHQKDNIIKKLTYLVTELQNTGCHLSCHYLTLPFSWTLPTKTSLSKITVASVLWNWSILSLTLLDLSVTSSLSKHFFLFWPQGFHCLPILLKSLIFSVRKYRRHETGWRKSSWGHSLMAIPPCFPFLVPDPICVSLSVALLMHFLWWK